MEANELIKWEPHSTSALAIQNYAWNDFHSFTHSFIHSCSHGNWTRASNATTKSKKASLNCEIFVNLEMANDHEKLIKTCKRYDTPTYRVIGSKVLRLRPHLQLHDCKFQVRNQTDHMLSLHEGGKPEKQEKTLVAWKEKQLMDVIFPKQLAFFLWEKTVIFQLIFTRR